MIDYLSVFLALGYFLFFIKWLKEQQQLKYMLTATCLGVLGFMVKGTSMLPVIIPLAYFILKYLITDFQKSEGRIGLTQASHYFSFNWKSILSIGVLALLPFIAGKLWIMHTDSVKALSDTTDLFAVANSDHWNYGSWEQRLDIQNWKRIWKRIPNSFLPQFTIIFPLIALIPFKENREKLEILYLSAIGILVTIVTFFNLYYVHNYYLMGISPYLAIVVGIGIYFTFKKLNTHKYTRPLILVLLIYMTVVYYNHLPYLKQSLRNNKASRLTAMGNYLQRITSDNEYIVVTDHGWSPHILYYAERKGLMIKKPEWIKHPMIKENNFTVVVGKRKYANLMANWNYHKLIKQVGQIKIFKVSNDSTDLHSFPEVKNSDRKKKGKKKKKVKSNKNQKANDKKNEG